MRGALIASALAVLLVGCETVPDLPPTLPPDPCPPSAAAAVEPVIDRVVLTPPQRLALDVAGIGALGDLYTAYALSEAQREARSARLEARLNLTREWCAARR